MKQLSLFDESVSDTEFQVQAILARRRRFNCSGINGEDIDLIRSAIVSMKGGA